MNLGANFMGQAGFFKNGKAGRPHPDSPNLTIFDIEEINRLGAPTVGIPARPVVDVVAKQHAKKLQSVLAQGIRNMHRTKSHESIKNAVTVAAQLARGAMEAYIRSPDTPPPPNAPSTVEGKGFNNPLFHHGHLAGSVEYRTVIKR